MGMEIIFRGYRGNERITDDIMKEECDLWSAPKESSTLVMLGLRVDNSITDCTLYCCC